MNKIKLQEPKYHESGWYIAIEWRGNLDEPQYLHSDGILRATTYNSSVNEYTGFFDDYEEALRAKQAYEQKYTSGRIKSVDEPEHMFDGWYIGVEPEVKSDECYYLHTDGVVRNLTVNKETGEYTGYFANEGEAIIAKAIFEEYVKYINKAEDFINKAEDLMFEHDQAVVSANEAMKAFNKVFSNDI